MRHAQLLLGILLTLILMTAPARALEVVEAVVTTAVVAREPVDEVEVFPAQTGKLYCFTRVVGASEPTVVSHLWYHGEQLMSRVELPVSSPDWRTWSAKRFAGEAHGEWRIEIQGADGQVLRQITFQLR